MKKIGSLLLILSVLTMSGFTITTHADDDAEVYSYDDIRFNMVKLDITPAGQNPTSEPIYLSAAPFNEGLSAIRMDDKYGFIDTEGNIALNFIYDSANNFSEGLAAIGKGENYDYKYGFIDKKGNIVIDYKYNWVGDFSEGLAPVMNDEYDVFRIKRELDYIDYEAHKYSYIDKKGKEVIKGLYDATSFSEGLSKSGKYLPTGNFHDGKEVYKWETIFIDKSGNEVFSEEVIRNQIKTRLPNIEIITISYNPFSEGLASFKLHYMDKSSNDMKYDYCGFIDKAGNIVKFGNYDGVGNFSEGKAFIEKSNDVKTVFEYVDKSFNTLFKIEESPFSYSQDFSDNLCVIYWSSEGSSYKVIDEKGNIITEPYDYDEITKFNNGKAIFKRMDELYLVTDMLYNTSLDGYMSNWAIEPIQRAIEKHLIPQSLRNNYKTNITREDFAALVVKTIEEHRGILMEDILFDKTGKELDDLVAEHKFAPYDSITREEAAALLMRTAKYLEKTEDLSSGYISFSDESKISNYAKEPVKFVSKLGIMNGVGNNTFNPKGTYTRQQAYTTMIRLFDTLE